MASAAPDLGCVPSVPRVRPLSPVLAESGHSWVADGFGTSNLNDTSDFSLGTQSVKVVTDGLGSTGTPARITNTSVSLNATDRAFVIWLKLDDETKLSAMTFYAGSGANWNNFYKWDFQSVGAPDSTSWFVRSGEWTIITLNVACATSVTGTPTRSAISRVRLSAVDLGASAPVTVRLNAVALTPDPVTQFPNGVVSITFDDSYDGHYSIARPRMDRYGFPGTTYTICDLIGTAGYCTVDQLHGLENTSGWEVAAHAFTANAHNNRFSSLTDSDLETELQGLKSWLVNYGFRGSETLAWPGGEFTPRTRSFVARYFNSARSTIKASLETAVPADRLKLRAYNVTVGTSTATVQALVDAAYANREWLILIFHKLLASGATQSIEYNQASFNTIVDYLNTKGVPVRTVGEVLSAVRSGAL